MNADSVFNFLHDYRGLPFRTMSVFNYLLEAALMGGLMILLVLFIRQFFRRQVGSRGICFAWLMVAVRLLVPLSLPNPIMNELRPTYSVDEVARPVADQFRVRFQDALHQATWSINYEQEKAQREEHKAAGLPMEELTYDYTLTQFISDVACYTSYGWTGKWFFFGYVAVAGGVALWMTGQNLLFRRAMRRSRLHPLSEELQGEYRELCRGLGCKPLPVWYADPLPGACLVGVLRPSIALPLSMPPAEVPTALLHEMCHYRARDNWWALVRNVCCVVQWFNPLVWLGAHVSRQDSELACDERVTAAMSDEARRDYAATLIHASARRSSPGLSVVATGMTSTGRRLKQRVEAILENAALRKWVLITFALCAGAVLLAAFATREAQTPTPYVEVHPTAVPTTVQDDRSHPRPLGSDFEACALAEVYVLDPVLRDYTMHGLGSSADFCALQDACGWHVSMLQHTQQRYLLMDSQGRLLGFETEQDLTALPYALPDPNIDLESAVLPILERYMHICLGPDLPKPQITALHGSATAGGITYCRVTAVMDGRASDVIVSLTDSCIAYLREISDAAPHMTQRDVLSMIDRYLTQTLGVDNTQPRMTLQQVMPEKRDGKTVFLGVISEQPNWMSPEAAARLEQEHGKQDRYAFQLVIDPESGNLMSTEFLPQAEYPNETQVLASYTAPDTLTTYELIKGRYLVQASSLPAGTAFDVLSLAHVYSNELVPTGGALNLGEIALIRFTHPGTGKVQCQWLPSSLLADKRYLTALTTAREVTCTADGKSLSLKGYDYQFTEDRADGFYTDPLGDAVPLETALAAALEAIQAEYGIDPRDFAAMPFHFGFYCNREQVFTPVTFWRIDLPDPRATNVDFEVYINNDGTIKDLLGPEEGNG